MHVISDGRELDEVLHWLTRASEIAPYSNCTKSQRGVVVVRDAMELVSGYIWHQDPDTYCNPCVRNEIHDNSQRALCGAEHAEQMCIRRAYENDISLHGSRLYHIKVKDGQMLPSGQPSCEICSPLILDAGIDEVVLWHTSGYTIYNSEEFHRLTLEHGKAY
ncbi:MAG: hypothetical protein ACQESG_02290 [Nanobdellota archaeon]